MISEILTAKIIAGIAWEAIKEGASVTKEYLRPHLKKWILTDDELELLSDSINNAPASDKRTQLYLEAYIDATPKIRSIIDNAKSVETYNIYASNNVQSPITGKVENQEIHYHAPSSTPEKKNT